jgi:hypothetical protein
VTAPLLIPAYPALLRAGLPVVCDLETDEGDAYIDVAAVVISLYGVDCDPDPWLTIGIDDRGNSGERAEALIAHTRLDLRNPAVRDQAVRALWRKLRPGEPEPLTAPRWDNNSEQRYSLVGRHMRGVSDTAYDVRFRPTPGGRSPECEDIVVPALGVLPRDSFERPQDFADRDLLALAAVLAAVLA